MTAEPAADDDPLAPFRGELRAVCYRMLGSFHDAEDLLQEISVRAWRGRPDFEGRSSLRTWLHRIAMNACLSELRRKERRVLPMDITPESEALASRGEPDTEVPWLEPFPLDPADHVVDTETVELAFVAALQHLSPNERAALILFDVLAYSAKEIAELMQTSAASVNSALQRARRLVAERVPERSQQQTLAALGDDGQRELASRYTTALREHDLDTLLQLLTADARWSMPPLPVWYGGHESIAGFLTHGPFTVDWRHRVTTANGQLAIGCYRLDTASGRHLAYALDVLEIRGDRVASVAAFLDGRIFGRFGLPESAT